ncbi:MAG: membrane integrity-associated transporter subunit PqiC [Deltaproteobacteria bacterium]|nr:membrane integrity-associated transporter subunit PqiC [Deltaproteobacteria bacterium]
MGAVLVALLLAGCGFGSFQRPAPTAVWLGLDAPPPSGGLRAGGPTLQVLPFSTATPFRTDRLAAKTGKDLWAFSHYHRWVAEPGDLVTASAARFFARCDLFGAVTSAGSPFEPEYRLGGSVHELYWDRTEGRVVLEVEASLVAYPSTFRGFWIRRAAVPVPGNDIAALPAAAGAALDQVLSELRKDLAASLAQAPSEIGATGQL